MKYCTIEYFDHKVDQIENLTQIAIWASGLVKITRLQNWSACTYTCVHIYRHYTHTQIDKQMDRLTDVHINIYIHTYVHAYLHLLHVYIATILEYLQMFPVPTVEPKHLNTNPMPEENRACIVCHCYTGS